MTFWFRKHHYSTNIRRWLKSFVFERPHFQSTMRPISHLDGCCDYWIPIDDPRAQRAFMLDDDLGFGNKK